MSVATLYYKKALEVAKSARILPPRIRLIWDMYSLEKAAAFNLCVILKSSGANHMAASIRRRYLSFE